MKPTTIHRAMQIALCLALYIVVEPLLRNPGLVLGLYVAGAVRITPFVVQTMRTVQKPYRAAGLLTTEHTIDTFMVHTITWPATVLLEMLSPGTLNAIILTATDDMLARRHRNAIQTVELAQRDIAHIEYFKANRS